MRRSDGCTAFDPLPTGSPADKPGSVGAVVDLWRAVKGGADGPAHGWNNTCNRSFPSNMGARSHRPTPAICRLSPFAMKYPLAKVRDGGGMCLTVSALAAKATGRSTTRGPPKTIRIGRLTSITS